MGYKHDNYDIKQSVKDLVRINKVTADEAPAYIRIFMRKYKISNTHSSLLIKVALDEISKSKE